MTVAALIAYLQTQPGDRRIVLWEDLFLQDDVEPRTAFVTTTHEGGIRMSDPFDPHAEEVVTL